MAKDCLNGVILVAVLLGAVGCRHAPVVPDTGRSSFRVIEPRAAAAAPSEAESPQPISTSQYKEARPIEPLILPVYPPKALAAKAGMATVGVHVTVDVNGRVSDVRPSVLTLTTPGRFAEDFREAVEAALRQWRFVPAEIQDLELIPGLEIASNRITGRERTEAEFELSFTFSADGFVQAGK